MHCRLMRAVWGLVGLAIAAVTVGAQGELVIVKDRLYHRPGCDLIRGATDVLAMSVGQAESRGFKSHPDCDPNVPRPPLADEPTREGAPRPSKPPAPTYVFVDTGGTLYHKETCRRLGTSPKKLELTASVAKKHWPCGVCKPPILPRAKKK